MMGILTIYLAKIVAVMALPAAMIKNTNYSSSGVDSTQRREKFLEVLKVGLLFKKTSYFRTHVNFILMLTLQAYIVV